MQLCFAMLAAGLLPTHAFSQVATQGDATQGDATQGDASQGDATQGVDTSTLPPDNQTDNEAQPATTQAAQRSTKQQPNAGVPDVPIRNSIEQATDAGLEPTLSNGFSTAATANGIVSSFPGLTSFGGQAASAAANSQKFLTYYASQALSYSDNPGQIASGQTILSSTFLGLNRPDFYEVTSGGALLSKTFGRQNFFASANFGITNYAHDTNFNSTQYSLSIGDNYAISDKCAGTIVANQSVSAVPLEFTVGSLSSQNTENTSGEINTRCRVYKNIFFTGNVTASKNSFTNLQVLGNNSNQMLGSVGAEYAVPSFVTAGFLTSIQETTFTGRNTLLLGLPSKTSQVNFNVYINKPITPKLNIALSAGITDLSSGSASLGGSIQPIYSASISYAYSPKTSVALSYARATGSPQSFVADFQEIETVSASVSYRFSPKLSFNAGANHSTTTSSSSFAEDTSSLTAIVNAGNLAYFAANTTTTSEQISANYAISQRASASLAYQHTTRDSGYLLGQAAANIVSLSLSYRH